MHFFTLSLLFLISTHRSQCRILWTVNLPEIPDLVLEKGKPIQLPENYEGVHLSGLNGTLYSDSLSQLRGLKELRISRHELKTIENGALCSPPDLKTLELNFYASETSLTRFTKDMFENCDHLEELILQFGLGRNYTIDNDAFEPLTSLKKLTLQSYKISHLTKDTFKLSPSLIEIALIYTGIEEVDADSFENLKNLERIIIIRNEKWTHLPKGLFKDLKKLKNIQLRDNNLKDLTWDEFEGLSTVDYLDVAFNKITSFDAEKVAKFMPNLRNIFIGSNPTNCQINREFVEELQRRLSRSLDASFKFDPGYFETCQDKLVQT